MQELSVSERPRRFASTTRLVHWINAVSVLGLMSSGWAIFNAAPFYPLEFPAGITLGGYLTPALRWHFLFMWTMAAGVVAQIALRAIARRGGPALMPIRPHTVIVEVADALRLRLRHEPGVYVHTQRLLYLGVMALLVLALMSGLALWKPVQLHILTDALGGYEAARRWHFWAMAGIAAFTVVHLAMVLAVPSSLLAILFGARPNREDA